MTDIDVSKIPADVMQMAEKAYWATTMPSFTQDPWVHIAAAIMAEREACAEVVRKLIPAISEDGPENAAHEAEYSALGFAMSAIRSRP